MAETDSTPDYIIVNDSSENWVLYKGDNAFLAALKVEPDEQGIRHVLPELTEGLHTWWWCQAVEKASKLVEELSVPWGELAITTLDIQDGNLMALSEKLACTSFYIVQVNNHLTGLLAAQYAAKEMLEHAVNRSRERGESGGGGRNPAIAARQAAIISQDKRLRNMKIEIIESGAAIKSLETLRESLDLLWRTTSRVLSSRMSEPID